MHHQSRAGLQINLRQWGPEVVLEIIGRLIIEAPIQSLVDLTKFMTREGRCLLVLDLKGVSQMDCSGIGQLVKLFVKVRRLGGRFMLVNVERRQRRLLDMAGLLTLFPAFDRSRSLASGMQNYDVA